MTVLGVLVGIALLFFGRQLFWLFVGGIGFIAGLVLATQWFEAQPEWVVLATAILGGIVGALLSIFLQRLAVGLAGFMAGGYALFNLATRTGYDDLSWVAWIVGGIIGALLITFLFDWALIVLSALAGAILVIDSVPMDFPLSLLLLVALVVAGVMAQSMQLRRRPVVDSGGSGRAEPR